jgi:hypothetical protein
MAARESDWQFQQKGTSELRHEKVVFKVRSLKDDRMMGTADVNGQYSRDKSQISISNSSPEGTQVGKAVSSFGPVVDGLCVAIPAGDVCTRKEDYWRI